jgi:hypothetical protein
VLARLFREPKFDDSESREDVISHLSALGAVSTFITPAAKESKSKLFDDERRRLEGNYWQELSFKDRQNYRAAAHFAEETRPLMIPLKAKRGPYISKKRQRIGRWLGNHPEVRPRLLINAHSEGSAGFGARRAYCAAAF